MKPAAEPSRSLQPIPIPRPVVIAVNSPQPSPATPAPTPTSSPNPVPHPIPASQMPVASAADASHTSFLGARSPYTTDLRLVQPSALDPIPCYHVLSPRTGLPSVPLSAATHPHSFALSDAELVRMYQTMVELSALDSVFYDAQRQGRISFYMTSSGEEATHIGSAAALRDDDVVFAQYRETGVLLYRGFSLQQIAHQCFSNQFDLGKGRQMPVHYGSKALHFHTISSPLGTQLPQAAGAAYALKREPDNQRVVICYFGEGAASEGDFHPAMNFAASLRCPVLFFCRNNGYAISTPSSEQYRGDGIASRAIGYGMPAIRVDGNDLLAVLEATAFSREYALKHSSPVLIEAMTYRLGHHSTSDDSTRYRSGAEIKWWQETADPASRFRLYLENRGLWNSRLESEARKAARKAVLDVMRVSEHAKKPPLRQLFQDVYDGELPQHLKQQEEEMRAHLQKYGQHYGLETFATDQETEPPTPIQNKDN